MFVFEGLEQRSSKQAAGSGKKTYQLEKVKSMGLLVLNTMTNPGPMPILNHIKSKARIFEPTTKYSRHKLKQDLKALGNVNEYEVNSNQRTFSSPVSVSPSSTPDASSLTPSLSSVLCQIKKRSKDRRNTGSTVSSTDSLRSILSSNSSPYGTSADNVFSDVGSKDDKTLYGVTDRSHPLSHVDSDTETSQRRVQKISDPQSTGYEVLPHTKMYNLNDLDFTESFSEKDILQPITPIYERPKNKRMDIDPIFTNTSDESSEQEHKRHRKFKPIFLQEQVVEMEHWPNSSQQQHLQTNSMESITLDPITQKRTRQQTLNPSFLRLYALETSMKQKNLLPDLNLDESILQRLSIQEISQLNIPADPSNRISPHQIKLALITRKKLWSDMCQVTRTDLHGEHAPANLKFVKATTVRDSSSSDIEEDENTKETTSLVRLNSEVKPWSQPEMSQPTMFKPCGRISLGKNANSKEIQYVVKGWCDCRFA